MRSPFSIMKQCFISRLLEELQIRTIDLPFPPRSSSHVRHHSDHLTMKSSLSASDVQTASQLREYLTLLFKDSEWKEPRSSFRGGGKTGEPRSEYFSFPSFETYTDSETPMKSRLLGRSTFHK